MVANGEGRLLEPQAVDRLQAEGRQLVGGVPPGVRLAADHQVLHAVLAGRPFHRRGVVIVDADESVHLHEHALQELQRLLAREHTGGDVLTIEGEQVLIETTHRVIARPTHGVQNEVEEPDRLHRLVERARGQAGHPAADGRHARQFRPTGGIGGRLRHPGGRLGVSRREGDDRPAADGDGLPELAARVGVLRIGRQGGDAFLGLAREAKQAALQEHLPGRGQVAPGAEPARLEVLVMQRDEEGFLVRGEQDFRGLADDQVVLADHHGHRLRDLPHGEGIETGGPLATVFLVGLAQREYAFPEHGAIVDGKQALPHPGNTASSTSRRNPRSSLRGNP